MRAYYRFVVIQLGIALASMALIVARYGYGAQIVWLNFLYVTQILLLQTMLIWLAVAWLHRSNGGLADCLGTAVITLTTGFLLALYAANLGSNEMWGAPVSGALVTELGVHVRGIGALFGVSPFVLYGALLLPFLGLYAFLYRWGRTIVGEFVTVHRKGVRHASLRIALGVLFSGYVGFYSTLVFGYGTFSEYRGEPLCSLLMPPSASLMASNRHLRPVLKRDRQTRTQYAIPASFERRNVILIIVDSLRASNLPMYEYAHNTAPFLSSLVSKGALQVVPHAFSTCPESVCGIASTLSSRNYNQIAPGLYKLHDLLFDAGYDVNFILSGSHSWEGLRELYGESIHDYVDGTSFANHSVNDDRGVLARLERHKSFDGKPAFFFFHLMTTHGLGRTLNFSDHFTGRRWLAWKSEEYYDASIKAVDAVIERLFALLEDKGYLQHSVAVILGDHGEAFGEHGIYGHIHTLHQETMSIPLLIYDPARKDYQIGSYATQLDVAPTIVDRLGLPVPETWQGRSLLRTPAAVRLTVHQTTARPYTFAVYFFDHGRFYKFITRRLFPSAFDSSDELYEIIEDPQEKRNIVASAAPELRATMLDALIEYQKSLLPYQK